MGDKTGIQWTEATWNPVRGCSRVSAGCENCYAERQAHRFAGTGGPYDGLTRMTKQGPGWTGEVRFVPEMLDQPLRWRKPRMVFVNSMSDLFHEKLSDAQIAAVFGVMAACPQHTFQVLTKRPKRMVEWSRVWGRRVMLEEAADLALSAVADRNQRRGMYQFFERFPLQRSWPLPNVWLGVSVENQDAADERIPLLLETPAACRMVSAEPLLGPLDLSPWMSPLIWTGGDLLDWVIVGSESGPGARPMHIVWAESLRDQCASAVVAFFTKQIANEHDRKGGNPEHWPCGLWPRQFPEVPRG